MSVTLPKQKILFLPELFKAMDGVQSREDKIALFRLYATKDANHQKCLQGFVELLLHPSVEFDLPPGTPPYTEASENEDQAPSNLFRVFREVGRFLKGSPIHIQKPLKREFYFISILESLSVRESKILIAIKDKNINYLYPSLTNDLICEAIAEMNWLPQEVLDANKKLVEESKKL